MKKIIIILIALGAFGKILSLVLVDNIQAEYSQSIETMKNKLPFVASPGFEVFDLTLEGKITTTFQRSLEYSADELDLVILSDIMNEAIPKYICANKPIRSLLKVDYIMITKIHDINKEFLMEVIVDESSCI